MITEKYDYRVPTKVAKDLFKKGYPLEILNMDGYLVPGYYVIIDGWKYSYDNGTTKLTDYRVYPCSFDSDKFKGEAIGLPSYAEAINWLREEKSLYCDIIYHENDNYESLVITNEKVITVGSFDNFKDAQLESIKDALRCI